MLGREPEHSALRLVFARGSEPDPSNPCLIGDPKSPLVGVACATETELLWTTFELGQWQTVRVPLHVARLLSKTADDADRSDAAAHTQEPAIQTPPAPDHTTPDTPASS